MSEMFSPEWMTKFQEAWNSEPALSGELAKIGFASTIAYGLVDEENPRGVIVVENGRVTSAGAFTGQPISWDIRASADDWGKWSKKPPGLMGLGMAYTARKLRFKVGDYGAMIKDPRMAGPFIKSFEVMGRV
ncbi:MAG: SCP-2 sterol transfer family protein [Alphaproteobacteria bacterium]